MGYIYIGVINKLSRHPSTCVEVLFFCLLTNLMYIGNGSANIAYIINSSIYSAHICFIMLLIANFVQVLELLKKFARLLVPLLQNIAHVNYTHWCTLPYHQYPKRKRHYVTMCFLLVCWSTLGGITNLDADCQTGFNVLTVLLGFECR